MCRHRRHLHNNIISDIVTLYVLILLNAKNGALKFFNKWCFKNGALKFNPSVTVRASCPYLDSSSSSSASDSGANSISSNIAPRVKQMCVENAVQQTIHSNTHTRLRALCPGLPGWAGTRKAKPIWILLKQEIVSGSGISWTICKSAPRSRQITTPAPHCSVFTGRMPFLPPNQSVKALKAWQYTVTS